MVENAIPTESGEYFGINRRKNCTHSKKTLQFEMTNDQLNWQTIILTKWPPVDKNIDRIVKYNACQLNFTKIIHHGQYDVDSVKGYKLTPNQALKEF